MKQNTQIACNCVCLKFQNRKIMKLLQEIKNVRNVHTSFSEIKNFSISSQ